MRDEGDGQRLSSHRTTHFDVKLHFGDEQFEVDAAQLPVAFAQVTLGMGEGGVMMRDSF